MLIRKNGLIVVCIVYHFKVRCLVDYGEFETEDGTIILLKKNSQVMVFLYADY